MHTCTLEAAGARLWWNKTTDSIHDPDPLESHTHTLTVDGVSGDLTSHGCGTQGAFTSFCEYPAGSPVYSHWAARPRRRHARGTRRRRSRTLAHAQTHGEESPGTVDERVGSSVARCDRPKPHPQRAAAASCPRTHPAAILIKGGGGGGGASGCSFQTQEPYISII